MSDIKGLSSTGIYAWTTLISCFICVPGALIFEGPKLKAGIDIALQKNPNFYWMLLSVGLLYHLYNQVRPIIDGTMLPCFQAMLDNVAAQLILYVCWLETP